PSPRGRGIKSASLIRLSPHSKSLSRTSTGRQLFRFRESIRNGFSGFGTSPHLLPVLNRSLVISGLKSGFAGERQGLLIVRICLQSPIDRFHGLALETLAVR